MAFRNAISIVHKQSQNCHAFCFHQYKANVFPASQQQPFTTPFIAAFAPAIGRIQETGVRLITE